MFQNGNFYLLLVFFILSIYASLSKADYLSNDECFTNLENNLKLEGLKDKVTLSNLVENQKLSLIVDAKKPNDNERKLLILWDELRQDCINQDLENLKSRALPIAIINLYQNKEQKFKFLLADLYTGKISYGAFNKMRQNNNISSKNEELQVLEKLNNNKFQNQSNSKSSLAIPIILPKCSENNRSHCFGEWVWNDGTKYVGEFENGKFNGKGTVFNPDGSVKEKGTYVNDYLIDSSEETKSSSQQSNYAQEQKNAKERQKGIDSLNCEVYAKNSTANQQPAVAYGDRFGVTSLLSATLIGMNSQDYYDSCMKRLGY